MNLSNDVKCIETTNFNVMGNIMTWQGMALQLSNVSYITTRGLEQLKFPWYALIMIAIGIGLFRASFIVSIILLICGGGIIYWWYREMKRRSQSIVLTMHMNSGDKLSLLFTDQSFLTKVLHVLEKIIAEGGIGENKISIDLSGSNISGDAQILNNLGINR